MKESYRFSSRRIRLEFALNSLRTGFPALAAEGHLTLKLRDLLHRTVIRQVSIDQLQLTLRDQLRQQWTETPRGSAAAQPTYLSFIHR
jgi:hypothetical protein